MESIVFLLQYVSTVIVILVNDRWITGCLSITCKKRDNSILVLGIFDNCQNTKSTRPHRFVSTKLLISAFTDLLTHPHSPAIKTLAKWNWICLGGEIIIGSALPSITTEFFSPFFSPSPHRFRIRDIELPT